MKRKKTLSDEKKSNEEPFMDWLDETANTIGQLADLFEDYAKSIKNTGKNESLSDEEKSKEQLFIDWLEKTNGIIKELYNLFFKYYGNIIATEPETFGFVGKKGIFEGSRRILSYKELKLLKEQNNNIITKIKGCLKELKSEYNKYKPKIRDGQYIIYENGDENRYEIDRNISHVMRNIVWLIETCEWIKTYTKKEATRMNKNKKTLPKEEIKRITQLAEELADIKNSYIEFRCYIYEDFNFLISVINYNVPKSKKKLPYIKFNEWENVNSAYTDSFTSTLAVRSNTKPKVSEEPVNIKNSK